MNYEEKRQEYAPQYQTLSAKNGEKFFSQTKRNQIRDSPDGFQKYLHAKKFPDENYLTRHSGRESLMIGGGTSDLQ